MFGIKAKPAISLVCRNQEMQGDRCIGVRGI
jgi:hypothetical protein